LEFGFKSPSKPSENLSNPHGKIGVWGYTGECVDQDI
jgi:hypothetical protein